MPISRAPSSMAPVGTRAWWESLFRAGLSTTNWAPLPQTARNNPRGKVQSFKLKVRSPVEFFLARGNAFAIVLLTYETTHSAFSHLAALVLADCCVPAGITGFSCAGETVRIRHREVGWPGPRLFQPAE